MAFRRLASLEKPVPNEGFEYPSVVASPDHEGVTLCVRFLHRAMIIRLIVVKARHPCVLRKRISIKPYFRRNTLYQYSALQFRDFPVMNTGLDQKRI